MDAPGAAARPPKMVAGLEIGAWLAAVRPGDGGSCRRTGARKGGPRAFLGAASPASSPSVCKDLSFPRLQPFPGVEKQTFLCQAVC